MKCRVILMLLGGLIGLSAGLLPELTQVHTRFEFMYSFKGPYLIDSKGNIPFWNYGGSAIPSEESVRVCPSIKSRRGWVWSKNSLAANHWVVDVTLRVTGRLKSGADGMAVWVTASPGTEGPVYGNAETWKGIGLFFDSFDNDGSGDNPKIQLVLNDGVRLYEHRSDGSQQQQGSCLKDFRNRPHPVKVRMSYIREVLEVWVHDGVSVAENDYEICLKLEKIPELRFIPKEVYFGVSAATGGLSDDHDVLSFITYSVSTLEERAAKELLENNTVFSELTDKYNRMAGEFDQRHEDYLRQHPDMASTSSSLSDSTVSDWQKALEMEQNMRVVVDMQVALQKEIRAVARKVDVLLSSGGGGGGVDVTASPGAVPSSLTGDLAQIKATESNILHQLADLRAALDRSVPEGAKATASEQLQPLYETKNLVGQQSKQLEEMTTLLQDISRNKCPAAQMDVASSCLSSWIFIAVMVIQSLVFIGYSLYSQAQERRAKKFF